MRLRLLPVLIIAAGATLTVRVGDLWRFDTGFGAAVAEEMTADQMTAEEMTAEEMTPDGQTMGADAQIENAVVPQAGADEADSDAVAEVTPGMDPETSESVGPTTDPFALTDTEIDLLQRLAERRAEIEQETETLEERRLLLQAAESRVDQKLEELKALQAMIQDLLLQHEEQEEGQIQSLVKIYESMKPKDAARIFEQLDMPVLLEVIGRMKERKTAPVLAQMNPEKAKARDAGAGEPPKPAHSTTITVSPIRSAPHN